MVVAAALWGQGWSRMHVALHVDNMAVVLVLEQHSPKDTSLAHLHCLFLHINLQILILCITHSDNKTLQQMPSPAITWPCSLFFTPRFLIAQYCRSSNDSCYIPPDWSSQAWINLFFNSLPKASSPHHHLLIIPFQHKEVPILLYTVRSSSFPLIG